MATSSGRDDRWSKVPRMVRIANAAAITTCAMITPNTVLHEGSLFIDVADLLSNVDVGMTLELKGIESDVSAITRFP